MTALSRPGLSVLYSTWNALFLRETVNRLSAGRAAWVWLLVEPMVHVFFMLAMFTLVRVTAVGGIDVTVWLTIGMLSFFLFRRTANQCANAIGANRALFTYRQVKPVDTVLVRAASEGFLMLLVISLAVVILALLDHRVAPADPLELMGALLGLWLVGLGYGLMASVAVELIPELGKILSMIMMPLYLMSGVMVQIGAIPEPYRSWLALNPLVHGLEAARLAFAPYYHTISTLSLAYLYGWALVLVFLGLALHVRFANRLVSQ
ncbi:ABC transporter permease [Massilia consociata]|uniref:Transport permease protein n=1 Tax=Massilia consociata TaxID=760117 RepID=A0ABV6FI68_9BURK